MLRRDHVAGGVFVVAGALVLALSRDLPFGTLAAPGAGMLPTLVLGLLMGLGALVVVAARGSPSLAALAWDDLPHAARVLAAMAAGVAVYTWLGFLLTMAALLFVLLVVVERRPLLPALAFSVGVPLLTHLAFQYLLKTPLVPGLLRF